MTERLDNGRQPVFVVHGRNIAVRDDMFDLLSAFGLEPLEWSRAMALTGHPNPFIGEVLDLAFEYARAVVVLFTPDDLASIAPELGSEDDPDYERQPTGQARPNVLFEAGLAVGRRPTQTVLVEVGRLRPFSDIAGRHLLRFDGSVPARLDLARRLEAAGCHPDLAGERWHTVGSFDLATKPQAGASTLATTTSASATSLALEISASSETGRGDLRISNQGESVIGEVDVEVPDDQPLLLLAAPPAVFLPPGQSMRVEVALLAPEVESVQLKVSAKTSAGSDYNRSEVVAVTYGATESIPSHNQVD